MDHAPTAMIVPLNVDSHRSTVSHDYSYRDDFSAMDRAEHLKRLKENFLASSDLVRTLSGWLTDTLLPRTVPAKFYFREFRAGDTFLLMRVLFNTRTLHTGVKLGLQNNNLSRSSRGERTDDTDDLAEQFKHYRDPQNNPVEMERASEFARDLHHVFLSHGLRPVENHRDYRTSTVIYEWDYQGQVYDVTLVTRLDTQRPYLDLVYVDG